MNTSIRTLLLWPVLALNTAGAQNLVVNSGFETASVGVPAGTPFPAYPTTLDGWGAVNTDGEFILAPGLAHTGNGLMSVLENGGQNPTGAWVGAPNAFMGYDRAVQVVPVIPGQPYVLRYWYRAGDGSRYGYGAGDAFVQVERHAPGFGEIAARQGAATADWQQDSILFNSGIGTTEVILLFSAVGTGPTDTWYDDVELELKDGLATGLVPADRALGWSYASGRLIIQATAGTSGERVTLVDAAGRVVPATVRALADRWEVNLDTCAPGAYVAVVAGPVRQGVVRFVHDEAR